jgi:O-antigen ligase
LILKKYNQIEIVAFLSSLIVPLLVTGPFLPDLLLSSLSLWFLHYVYKTKSYHLFRNNFFYFFLAFCLFCIFSSLMSDNIMLSFESSLFYFRIGIFCLLISFLIEHDKKILEFFYYILIITFVTLIFYAFLEFIFELHPHPSRISSFFGSEKILGSYLSRLLPLIIAIFFVRKNKSDLEKNLFLIFLGLVYFAIFLSGERAAFFYVNLSILFIIFFINIRFKFFFSIALVFLSIFTIFIIVSNFNDNAKRIFNRYKHAYTSMNLKIFLAEDKKQDNKLENSSKNLKLDNDSEKLKIDKKRLVIFTSGHESLYFTAFNMFLDRPIIGHGPKMFRVKCADERYRVDQFSCMTHPHNFYIQLLAETGIIGFSFLFILLIYVIYLSMKYLYYRYIKKKKIYSQYQICLLACLLITIWPVIPNGNFFNNYLMIIYCLPLGFFKKKIKI